MENRKERLKKVREDNLKKARKTKRAACPTGGCAGQLTARSSSKPQARARTHGHYVYFPGKCKVRTRKCALCGLTIRTVELPLTQYDKDITLIHRLKGILREYIES